MMGKLFLWVYNDNSNVIQLFDSNIESNIDSNCLYSQKKIDFSEITFAFYSNTIWKKSVWQITPRYDILKLFWAICACQV